MGANCERLMGTKGMSPGRADVVLYTRPGCHLCDEAKAEMEKADCRAEYELVEINIETDPDLVERYGSEIPVVLINGVKAFKYRLTAEEFKRKLRRLAGG
jgi:glutaredoxin